MIPIFFFVMNHEESGEAYTALMRAPDFTFKTFEIRGHNVKKQLKKRGIDKVPTLYFPEKKGKIVGSDNIIQYIETKYPPVSEQSRRKKKKSRQTKPDIPIQYQKALKDEFYNVEPHIKDEWEENFSSEESEDSFESRYNNAVEEESSESIEESDEVDYDSDGEVSMEI